jgi:RNA polymerase sigma-70 factor (ECF subfamily)
VNWPVRDRRDPLADTEALIRQVYRYAAYHLGDGPEAEDVTSEVFERALRYQNSYDARRGKPIAWLIGIARRCIDDARKLRPPAVSASAEKAAQGDLEEEVVRRLSLLNAVASLGERDRELIALRYGAGLTAREIGEFVGARTNTVKVALHRARARLRTALGEEDASTAPAAPPGRVTIEPPSRYSEVESESKGRERR